jgi:hypothetical protein
MKESYNFNDLNDQRDALIEVLIHKLPDHEKELRRLGTTYQLGKSIVNRESVSDVLAEKIEAVLPGMISKPRRN